MSAFALDEQQVKFVHIPKSAGSSITKWTQTHFPNYRKIGRTSHLTLAQLNAEDPTVKDYFGFCVVRNTYDRLVSYYEFIPDKASREIKKLRKHNKLDGLPFWQQRLQDYAQGFEAWLDTESCRNEPDQLSYIFDEDGNQINHIIRYENFDAGFKVIQDKLGVQEPIIPYNVRSEKKPYQEYYDKYTLDKVDRMYKNEIDYFGFTFDS